jgi:hypothetical protein
MDPVELAFSTSCAVPAPPEYPGKYAAFIPRRPDNRSGKAAHRADEPLQPAIVFTNENLEVIRVPSLNSIPAADRKASRMVGADSAKYQSADPNNPFILFGPVDVEVGPLVGTTEFGPPCQAPPHSHFHSLWRAAGSCESVVKSILSCGTLPQGREDSKFKSPASTRPRSFAVKPRFGEDHRHKLAFAAPIG